MRLFIVGATGRTGQLVIEQVIARAHVVTAIVVNQGRCLLMITCESSQEIHCASTI